MAAQSDDTSLDELLALYQTAQDAPAPFAPMGEPDAYPAFPAFEAPAGDPATDQPFPPFGSDGDLSFPAFGEQAFPAFGEAAAEAPIHAPADFAAPTQDFGFGGDAFPPMEQSAPPFGLDAPAADHAAPGGFDFSNWDSAVPPVDGAGAPAFEPMAAQEELQEFNPDEFSGPVFGAIDASAPAFPPMEEAAAPAFPPMEPAEAAGFGEPAFGEAAFPAFGAEDAGMAFPPMEDAAPAFPPVEAAAQPGFGEPAFGEAAFPAFGAEEAGPVFPPMEEPAMPVFQAEPAPAFEPMAAQEELQEFNPDEFSGPVFGAIDESAPAFPPMEEAAAPAFPPMEAAASPGFGEPAFGEAAFPAFGTEAPGMVFPPVEDAAPVFPPLEAAVPPAAPIIPPMEEAPPVFPAFEEPAPVIPPVQATPLAPPPQEPVAPPVFEPVAPPVQQAPPPPQQPVAPPPVQQAPTMPEVDPEATLRLREVEVQSQPAPQPNVAIAGGADVTIRTPDDRKNVNYQLTQAIGSLNSGLDELQGKLAFLYGDLQRAAVRRAPVEEMQSILQELAQSKSRVGQGSDLYKQALLLRQVADAYLQLLQEL
ncbi:MAG TPA: hypothetical protein V6D47_20315 [Oscillatoriaceae cyanobacterium]